MIERTVERLRVVVHTSPAELAAAAADEAAAVLRAAVGHNGVARAMFATGNSQLDFVDQLTTPGRPVPWDRTVVFHMDEYVGVGPEHPAGFARWIRQRIAQRARPRAVHYLDGLAEPAAECRRYAALLAEAPLDLCCLGIGENGHLAFNDPGVADFADPETVKVVELDQRCRLQQVHEGHFAALEAVPARAMTVTVPALLGPWPVLALVPEERKAAPVRQALEGPYSTACPASALRQAPNAVLHLEPASAALL